MHTREKLFSTFSQLDGTNAAADVVSRANRLSAQMSRT